MIRSLDVFSGMEPFSRLQSTLLSKDRDELTKLRDSLASSNVTAMIETPTGSPSISIIKIVLRDKHDLVITTAQGSTAPMGTLLRSLSLHLIRKCPCPVWVVHPEKPRRVGHVLAAVDPTIPNNGNSTVNSLILDLSISLSKMDDAKLHILHAYYTLELEGFENLLANHGTTSIPEEDHQACVEAAINKRKSSSNELLLQHPLSSVEHQTYFLEGPPSKVIPEAAKEQEVDVIVL
ncbi:MAG: universal stress protein, partial [Verrucomicrobiales bacterium]